MEYLMQNVAKATPDASNKHALATTATHAGAAAKRSNDYRPENGPRRPP